MKALSPQDNLQGKYYYYPHLMDEEIETHK